MDIKRFDCNRCLYKIIYLNNALKVTTKLLNWLI